MTLSQKLKRVETNKQTIRQVDSSALAKKNNPGSLLYLKEPFTYSLNKQL